MNEFKRDLVCYVLTIFLLIILVLAFLGCSEDRLDVKECYCVIKTTTEKITIVNGIPKTTYTTTTEKWGTDCEDDGIKFANSIIICN